MVGSQRTLKMHVRNLEYPFPLETIPLISRTLLILIMQTCSVSLKHDDDEIAYFTVR